MKLNKTSKNIIYICVETFIGIALLLTILHGINYVKTSDAFYKLPTESRPI